MTRRDAGGALTRGDHDFGLVGSDAQKLEVILGVKISHHPASHLGECRDHLVVLGCQLLLSHKACRRVQPTAVFGGSGTVLGQ